MRLLLLLVMCTGCAASRIENPYVKETLTSPDGTVRVIESSANWIEGGTVEQIKPKR